MYRIIGPILADHSLCRILINELFEMICKKENLSNEDHVLHLPKSGGKQLKFDQDTVLGSLNVREVFIVRTTQKAQHSDSIKVLMCIICQLSNCFHPLKSVIAMISEGTFYVIFK